MEKFKEIIISDEDNILSIEYNEFLGKYLVWFNGVILNSSKTKFPAVHKFSQLRDKYNLTEQ